LRGAGPPPLSRSEDRQVEGDAAISMKHPQKRL
jgi:hypothetical protein